MREETPVMNNPGEGEAWVGEGPTRSGRSGTATTRGSARRMRRHRRVSVLTALAVLIPTLVVAVIAPAEPTAAAQVFTVDTTLDVVDVNPGDGECATGAGTCSLRAAVQEANALAGADIIRVPWGTYNLTIFGAAEDLAGSGDLDIAGPVTIEGDADAPGMTVIDGNANDRVLHLLETAGNVSISGVTIRGGFTEEDGGGVYSLSGGTVDLDSVIVTGNSTASDGGGIHTTTGTLLVRNGSVVSNNQARNGGGVFNGGELSIAGVPSNALVSDSTITGNTAVEGGGGGIWNDHEGSLALSDVTVTDNFANDNGGGISVVSKARQPGPRRGRCRIDGDRASSAHHGDDLHREPGGRTVGVRGR
jgi:CSLREA domain-containing protein